MTEKLVLKCLYTLELLINFAYAPFVSYAIAKSEKDATFIYVVISLHVVQSFLCIRLLIGTVFPALKHIRHES